MRIEVQPAGALEMTDVVCKDGKLSGQLQFFKHSRESGALVIRLQSNDGEPLRTMLVKVSGLSGQVTLKDMTPVESQFETKEKKPTQ